MTRALWYLTLLAALAWLTGCGNDDTAAEPHTSTTGGVCYQESNYIFHAEICPGRVDVGVCSFALPDGRTLHPVHCITQRGVTCIADCKEIR